MVSFRWRPSVDMPRRFPVTVLRTRSNVIMQSNTENGNQKGPASLPHPRRERWQPLRSGFLNLYRYDREEFHYESGRLLLRGNNGTGKSRVLALDRKSTRLNSSHS